MLGTKSAAEPRRAADRLQRPDLPPPKPVRGALMLFRPIRGGEEEGNVNLKGNRSIQGAIETLDCRVRSITVPGC